METAKQCEAPNARVWEDLVDVLVSPAGLFRRHRNGRWLKPWIVISIVGVILYYLFLPATSALSAALMQAEMAKRGIASVPETVQSVSHTFLLARGVLVPVSALVRILAVAFGLWAIAAAARSGLAYTQAMTIAAWALMVTLLQQVAVSVITLAKVNAGLALDPTRDLSFGVLRFVDRASLPLALSGFLGAVDVFLLWQAVLWYFGLKAIDRMPARTAAFVSSAAWLAIGFFYAFLGGIQQIVLR